MNETVRETIEFLREQAANGSLSAAKVEKIIGRLERGIFTYEQCVRDDERMAAESTHVA